MRIGVVVNPYAGLGGAVGLKGTDGAATVAEALRRGARPQAGGRVRRAFQRLAALCPGTPLVAAPGQLGADHLAGLDLRVEELAMAAPEGTARDTLRAVRAMGAVDLMVFGGGDGSARDVAAALAGKSAMLGIPCGVKMHSAVFALTPEAAGNLLAEIATRHGRIEWRNDVEIMDIDERMLRAGSIAPQLYGYVRAPEARRRMQAAKGAPRLSDAGHLAEAAAEIAATMQKETLYVVGPGTSTGLIVRALGQEPTLLGVDAVLNGTVVARDADAARLEELAAHRAVKIVLSVTGRQGFLLGRGNQQISRAIVGKAGRDGIVVLASEAKLAGLAAPLLAVDTGDPQLDESLCGFIRVQTGAARFMLMRIRNG